jgi:ribulose-phosphate 3-epimerase
MMNTSRKIRPAIIAENQKELDTLLSLVEGKVDTVMLDFMDGKFVNQKSLNFDPILPDNFNYEAHLMVNDPISFIDDLSEKINRISAHIESVSEVDTVITKSRAKGLKISLALNPGTSLEKIIPHLDKIDGVLVMTVEPGRYGGEFLPDTLDKVRELRKFSDKLFIEVDGGMNPINAKAAKEAGADAFASGSYILKSGDIVGALRELEEAVS